MKTNLSSSLTFTKKGLQYKLLKIAFEKYFLWKMKKGFNGLP